MIPVHTSWRPLRAAAAALALALAAACADEPGPPAAGIADEALTRTMVDRVASAEIGRTHRGFILSAIGAAQGDGWRAARLRPRLGAPDAEGNLDFDFIALPPPPPGREAEVDALARAAGLTQRLRADTPLAREQLAGARAVRVFARDGVATVLLQAAPAPSR